MAKFLTGFIIGTLAGAQIFNAIFDAVGVEKHDPIGGMIELLTDHIMPFIMKLVWSQ